MISQQPVNFFDHFSTIGKLILQISDITVETVEKFDQHIIYLPWSVVICSECLRSLSWHFEFFWPRIKLPLN